MKNVKIGMYKSLIMRNLSVVFFLFFTLNLTFAQGERTAELDQGMQLFKNNCGSCHAKNMKAKMTGPALA